MAIWPRARALWRSSASSISSREIYGWASPTTVEKSPRTNTSSNPRQYGATYTSARRYWANGIAVFFADTFCLPIWNSQFTYYVGVRKRGVAAEVHRVGCCGRKANSSFGLQASRISFRAREPGHENKLRHVSTYRSTGRMRSKIFVLII